MNCSEQLTSLPCRARIGSPSGRGGVIEQKALWKLRRGEAGTFAYAGRVSVREVASMADARVEGPIIQLINGGKPKGGTEVSMGRFEAVFQRLLVASEEAAASDTEATGGAPVVLQTVCVATTAVRCQY